MRMNILKKLFLWCCPLLLLAFNTASAFELQYVGASSQEYSGPHDLVISPDGKYLFVADNNNDRIAVLDPTDLKLITTFGDNEVGAPHDVDFDTKGRLLVADTDNSRIAIYTITVNNTSLTAKLTGELHGKFRRPEGVGVHADGRIYVTGASSDNVEVFRDGRSIGDTGGLSSPHDVVVSKDGTIWIADAGNDRLVHMTDDLKVIKTLKGKPYHFSGPRYLDFDGMTNTNNNNIKSRLYVADKHNHQVKVLASDGTLLLTLGTGEKGLGAGKFNRPEGITIHGSDIWFSDTYNDRIVKYRILE